MLWLMCVQCVWGSKMAWGWGQALGAQGCKRVRRGVPGRPRPTPSLPSCSPEPQLPAQPWLPAMVTKHSLSLSATPAPAPRPSPQGTRAARRLARFGRGGSRDMHGCWLASRRRALGPWS